MNTVYVSIGNSDDKLTQQQWHDYVCQVDAAIRSYSDVVHGEWFSRPDSRYQNACWCFEPSSRSMLIIELSRIRSEFMQESIAWADAVTVFIGSSSLERVANAVTVFIGSSSLEGVANAR